VIGLIVDFKVKLVPSINVAYIINRGPYKGPNMWRSEFNQLTKWAKKRKLRTGKWIMGYLDKWGKVPDNQRRYIACLEIKGKAKPDGKVQVMKLPKQKVVSVIFNPDAISADVIYYAIESWLQYNPYKQIARSREVYTDSPWTNPRAWANCEVQVPLKHKSRLAS
jgi:DNA gyrase inhibitor GyrI